MKARETKPTKPQSGAREEEPARPNEAVAPQSTEERQERWGWLRPEEIEATFDDATWGESRWAP